MGGCKKVKIKGNLFPEQDKLNRQDLNIQPFVNLDPHKASLPEEILEIIFDYLTNPQDVLNVSKTCKQFQRILAPSRSMWLFVEVLPLIFNALKKPDILACRQVCRLWKGSFTCLFNNHPKYRPYDPNLDKHLNPASPIYHINLEKKKITGCTFGWELGTGFQTGSQWGLQPQRWLQKMKGHQGDPFVVPSVDTHCIHYSADQTYWKYCSRFLRKYGKHVLHLKVLFQDRGNDYLAFYKTFRRWLLMTPNLQTVALDRMYDMMNPNDDLICVNYLELKEYIRYRPLPPLPHLSTMSVIVEEFSYTSSQQIIVNELFRRYQHQLKRVKMDPNLCDQELERDYNTLKKYFWNAKNLTELQLTENSDAETYSSVTFFVKHVVPLGSLHKLTIKIMNRSNGHNIQNIMEALVRFPQLKFLKLVFWFRPEINGNRKSRLSPSVELPSVKILDVFYHTRGGNVYDGILCYLPELQYFHVHHWNYFHGTEKCDGVKGDEIFQVKKSLRAAAIYNPKIWGKLKRLREFSCGEFSLGNIDINKQGSRDEEVLHFTRDGYERKIYGD